MDHPHVSRRNMGTEMNIPERIHEKLKKFELLTADTALQLGLNQGSKDYQKFIILGKGRTGSNMLASALRSHTQIVAYGELFNNADHHRILWEHPEYIPYRPLDRARKFRERDPRKFVEKFVFRRYPLHVAAVGFKLFYYHAQEKSWESLWPLLRGMSGLKVIHITRKNMLRSLLSLKIAFTTREWSRRANGGAVVASPIELEYAECLNTFQKTREWEEKYDIYFDKHNKINVIYEDLVKNYSMEMKRIQDFLGVKYELLHPSTSKQNNQALSKAISNYWDLKERFENSPWTEFFEE